jgi:phosphoesterase RecJ-like protein
MEELERFNFVKGDTEGLVNVALSVRGVESAVFLKETNSAVKMSFRSKGAPVNGIASDHFDGGGHKYAAGGVSYLEMDETIEKLKSVLINYF